MPGCSECVRRRGLAPLSASQAYTPVSPADAKGFIDLLIKVYLPSGKFAGGRMTTGFDELELGDTIELKGPLGSFVWKGKGVACPSSTARRC